MYQFVSRETYSLSQSEGILLEAARVPEFCKHIENPKPYITLYGTSPTKLAKFLKVDVPNARQTVTKKLRNGKVTELSVRLHKRKAVLLAGVVSFPRDWCEKNPDMWLQVLKDTLAELKYRYGPALKSVAGHDDEAHPHLHFFCVAPGYDMALIDTATAAENALGRSRILKNARDRKHARRTALLQFQEEWHQVFYKYGFLKYGPRRTHVSTRDWKATRSQQASLGRLIFDADQKIRELEVREQSTLSTLGLS